MVNHLTKLLELYPDKPWNWYDVSKNPNITWEYIMNNPDKLWNWYGISGNPNITWEIVQNNLNKPWDWSFLSKNKNITWEIIQKNPTQTWSWLKPECIKFYYKWYMRVSNKKTMINNSMRLYNTCDVLEDIIKKNYEKKWSYEALSENSNLTWKIVSNNLDKNWNWDKIYKNPTITFDLYENLKDLRDREWEEIEGYFRPNIYFVSKNSKVTWEIIVDGNFFKYLDWDWRGVSENPNITQEIINNNPTKNWNYSYMSNNSNITFDFVKQHIDKPWDWRWLSQNPNITWDIIKQNPCYLRDYIYISHNPNLTWEIVHNNIHKSWCWSGLSENIFDQPASPPVCYL